MRLAILLLLVTGCGVIPTAKFESVRGKRGSVPVPHPAPFPLEIPELCESPEEDPSQNDAAQNDAPQNGKEDVTCE